MNFIKQIKNYFNFLKVQKKKKKKQFFFTQKMQIIEII